MKFIESNNETIWSTLLKRHGATPQRCWDAIDYCQLIQILLLHVPRLTANKLTIGTEYRVQKITIRAEFKIVRQILTNTQHHNLQYPLVSFSTQMFMNMTMCPFFKDTVINPPAMGHCAIRYVGYTVFHAAKHQGELLHSISWGPSAETRLAVETRSSKQTESTVKSMFECVWRAIAFVRCTCDHLSTQLLTKQMPLKLTHGSMQLNYSFQTERQRWCAPTRISSSKHPNSIRKATDHAVLGHSSQNEHFRYQTPRQ